MKTFHASLFKSFWWALGLSAGLFAITSIFYYIPPLNNPEILTWRLAADVVFDTVSVFAVLLLLYGWAGLDKTWKGKLAWFLIFISVSALVAGDLAWDLFEDITLEEAPYPGVPDIFYVAAYPFMAAALIRLARMMKVRLSLSKKLILVFSAVALLTLVTVFVIIPTATDPDTGYGLGERLLDAFYPLMDVVLVWFAILLLLEFWGGSVPTTYVLLLAGILVMSGGDVSYFFIYEDYGFQNPLDLTWLSSHLLLALAAVHERTLHAEIRKELAGR